MLAIFKPCVSKKTVLQLRLAGKVSKSDRPKPAATCSANRSACQFKYNSQHHVERRTGNHEGAPVVLAHFIEANAKANHAYIVKEVCEFPPRNHVPETSAAPH